VVFLDLDGVLVTTLSDRLPRGLIANQLYRTANDGVSRFDSGCVRRLNQLTDQCRADIVLSSMWRTQHPWEPLCRYIADEGVTAPIIGRTPAKVSYRERGLDIKRWLDDHPERTTFVILDDMGYPVTCATPGLSRYLVETNAELGLQDHDVARAATILHR